MGRTSTTSKGVAGAIALSTAAVFALAVQPAAGDGLPVPGGVDTTHQGVLSSDGSQRYLAIPHGGSTLLERVDAASGVLQRSSWIDGTYTVPGVTIDGDTDGLARDDTALVLIHPRRGFPQAQTSMVLLDPASLRVRRRIELDGDFSFDAISPDGETAYLIQYPDPRDPTDYRLRTLSLQDGTLAPGSLLPENDPEEEMRGFPLARASGADGRWQYTLYDGGTLYAGGGGRGGDAGEPFVHAIDTVGRRTLCIDLDFVTPARVSRVGLEISSDGRTVEVVDPLDGVLGVVDVATGEARAVSDADAADADPAASTEDGGISAGGVAALGLGALALLALVLAGALRRRGGGDSPRSGAMVG